MLLGWTYSQIDDRFFLIRIGPHAIKNMIRSVWQMVGVQKPRPSQAVRLKN